MKIEKGIAPPSKKIKVAYIFADTELNDSVFFDGELMGSQSAAAFAARLTGRKYGRKFTTRSIDGGVRIWRIA